MACGGGVFCVSLFMRMSRFLSPRLETTLGFRLFSRQCFFLWGGLRVWQERTFVTYQWGENPKVYRGIVQTVPENVGKLFVQKSM